MCREVLREFGESFEEAASPDPGAPPFAKGAHALVAHVRSPQLRFCGPLRHLRDVYPQGECAIAYGLRDVDGVGVHRKVLADGRVVTPMPCELAEYVRMRMGRFSKSACGCNRRHDSSDSCFVHRLPPIHYKRNP